VARVRGPLARHERQPPPRLAARLRARAQVIKCELFDEKVDAMVRRFPAA
jgi:hypothetical protein